MRKCITQWGVSVLVGFLLAVFFNGEGLAQVIIQHQQPTLMSKTESNELRFFVPGIGENEILEALLFYRNDGDLGYNQKEARFENGELVVTLYPDELTGNRIEYYFQLSISTFDQDLFYPENLPAEYPVEVSLVEESTKPERKKAKGIDYTILSPNPGYGVTKENSLIAISLFYDINEVEPGEFKLFVNGTDVTEKADTSAYFISYKPKDVKYGAYTVTLDYQTEDELLAVTEWEFLVVDPSKATFQGFEPRLLPEGRVELTARNQTISGDQNNAYTARTSVNGSYGLFKYSLNGFLTSQESNRLQPQTRYGLEMSLGKWWKFEAGHVYPTMSRFTISGRRIYGINTSMHLLWENLNFQFLYGEVNRKVSNLYSSVSVDTVYASGIPQDTTYTLGYKNSGRGTFKRKIIGGRVGLGNPKHFQLGIQAMKVEDDTASIFNVITFDDLRAGSSSLYNSLNMADINRLTASPELLQIEGGSPRPKGNFVAGADLRFSLAKNKIRFNTETVASALNNDIYGGPLDKERAADLGFEDIDQKDLDILTEIAQFIIINENITVLPIRFSNFNSDSSDVETFFPTSILGSNSELSFNYPRNSFTAQYRWVGPEFVSLANSTIRKDIAGFTFNDRFRMFDNRLYVTLGYETLTDNVANTKDATTKTNSYRSNLSWFPIKDKLPRVSFGFRYRTRDNGVERFNPEVPSGLENAALQNVRIVDGDTLISAVPRQNSTVNINFSVTQTIRFMDMVHDATVSVSTLNTRDEVFAFGDVRNSSVSLNIGSRFVNLPLKTQLGMNLNHTESGNGLLDLDIFGLFAGGSYFMLDNKLVINGRLAFTNNTTRSRNVDVVTGEEDNYFDDYYVLSAVRDQNDFGTYVLIAGAEYKFDNHHSLLFDSNFTNVTGANTFNDHFAQLRYIYRF